MSAAPATSDDLAAHVAEIRRRGRRVVTDVIEIGRRLKACKAIVGHGEWQAWLKREFDWSESTALNFVRVHDLAEAKSATVTDLKLPLKALYMLAAPSVPAKTRDGILERAAAGEPVSTAEVKQKVARARRGAAKTESTEANSDGEGTEKSAAARKAHYAVEEAALISPNDSSPNSESLGSMGRIFLKTWERLSQSERWRVLEEIGAADFVAAMPSSMRAEVLKRLQAAPKKITMENIGGTYEASPRASRH